MKTIFKLVIPLSMIFSIHSYCIEIKNEEQKLSENIDIESTIYQKAKKETEEMDNLIIKYNLKNKGKNYIIDNSYDSQVAREIYEIIHYFSNIYKVDENIIIAIMKVESNFNNFVESPAGAIGLMQIMPSTAEDLGINPYDMYENIKGGIKYFRYCLDNNNEDIGLALASYNAGYGNVKKYDTIPPFTETQNYVDKVVKIYNELSEKNYTFNTVEFQSNLDNEDYKLDL